MLARGYAVDVVLICHYTLRPERYAILRQALPTTVGLQVWDDATPLAYADRKKSTSQQSLVNDTLHLARQHRYVIKDKLHLYDMFVCFEDDMLIQGAHVDHYRAVTAELQRLRGLAPVVIANNNYTNTSTTTPSEEDMVRSFAGPMTKDMLQRVIPGFIRVETLLDEAKFPAQKDTGPVPVDLHFGNDNPQQQQQEQQIESHTCCHLSAQATNAHRPATPTPDQIMLWETHVYALGIRQMPLPSWLDWVVLQRGPNYHDTPTAQIIGDYWSNRNYNYFDTRHRIVPHRGKFINNQGGWMATRRQIWEWHTTVCPGGFLPPFDEPHYPRDGLDKRNVEYYSGGLQLATSTKMQGCNLQRIILLEPSNFSKSLLYHTANNKQRQLAWKRDEMFVKANTLLGQLNHLKKKANEELLYGIVDTTDYKTKKT
eukprot:scaffold36777_cov199-Amphora_coffeaeformis.AAC.2